MLSCKEVSILVSESMDRELPFRTRMAVRFHHLMCRYCLRYLRQIRFLQRAGHRMAEGGEAVDSLSELSLSEESRERIRQVVQKNI